MALERGALQVLLFLVICSFWLLSAKGDFHIAEGTFSKDNMVTLAGASIDEVGSLSLIPHPPISPRQIAGVAYYNKPVRMLDIASNSTGSFSTWFKSHQIAEAFSTNGSNIFRGDGMTLCFSSQGDWVGGVAGRLGLFPNGNKDPTLKLFAIEYDDFRNVDYDDPTGDAHVGIDTDSPISVATALPVGVKFWQGTRVDLYSWIDYNGTSHLLEISVANNNSRPATPLLSHTIDLFGIVDEEMWVGFSSGNGDRYSFFHVDEWEFSSSLAPLPSSPGSDSPGARSVAPGPSGSSSSSSLGLIAGGVATVLVLGALGAFGLFVFVRRRRNAEDLREDDSFREMVAQGMPDHYSYKQLSVATKAFSEASKLGEGGFGSVYRGVLPSNGLEVAVKRVSADSKQGEREFLAEVSIISQIRHRSVVQLVGWCKDKGKFLLVYELMRNGSLDKALFCPESPATVLSWEQRMRILEGLASGLYYLHEGWRQQVIHRDVKSSNIMLDDEFNAKLGDFGLARLVDHSKHAATTLIAGTSGYMAPEALITGKFTDKTDVYAFGAVALEIATGRKAFDANAPHKDIFLVDMVWKRLGDGELVSVVDDRLEGKFEIGDLEVVLLMGLLCSHPDANSRPTMRQVVQVLAGDAPVPPVPATKPAAVFSSEFAITIDNLRTNRSSDNDTSGSSFTASTMPDNSRSFMSKSSYSSTGITRP